ncbi:MAG TPA: hypothetical protein VFI59_01245 [Actinomycetota bacterium]|nr:hypothetical protein [Actinomycetota bacterium]
MKRARRLPRAFVSGTEPIAARKKWRAILLSTLLLAVADWSIVAGLVSMTADGGPRAGPFIAFGLALIPFVFLILAFASEHPRAPAAVLKAMGLTLLVGIPVSALAADAATGLVAAVGAGGIVALRSDLHHHGKARALAVLAATAWVFVTLRIVPEAALLLAPILPFTSIGVADHLCERRAEIRSANAA